MNPVSQHTVTDKAMRWFAFTTSTAVVAVFGLLLPWLWSYRFPVWPWVVLVVLGAWGLLYPASLGPIYRSWMKVAAIMGAVNNRIVLGFVFFVFFVPVGRIRGLFGSDPIAQRIDKTAKSYRIANAKTPSDMERLF